MHRSHCFSFYRKWCALCYWTLKGVDHFAATTQEICLINYTRSQTPPWRAPKPSSVIAVKKGECPSNGQCLTSGIVYQAKIRRKDNDKFETYVSLTADDFKTRYRNHKTSFENKTYRNSTELSKHVWLLKDNNIQHEITWQIVCRAKPYSSSTKRCNLCLSEKFVIICEPGRGAIAEYPAHQMSYLKELPTRSAVP